MAAATRPRPARRHSPSPRGSRRCRRPALRLIKRCLTDGLDATLEEGLAIEREAAIEALAQPEAREGLSAFLEKRAPRFHG